MAVGKNSSAKVYGAITAKGTEPTDADWEELDHSSKINLNGSKCSVSIVPNTEKGTPADSDSGMSGVYMTISSDLTLNGTPKDAGAYLISVSITDTQGRTAVKDGCGPQPCQGVGIADEAAAHAVARVDLDAGGPDPKRRAEDPA